MPGWIDEAVVYGVIPHNVGSGGLRDVTGRLPSLEDLGVSALWLSPIFRRPPGDFGYAVTDYLALEPAPDGGSEQDLRDLVREAHGRGIRVLLDFVPNHTSDQHPHYLEAQRDGPGSRYWDWYDRDEHGERTYYFDWTNLPNLNYEKAEVRRFISEAMAYWVREFDVDGYRVDACWGVRMRRPDFWPELRRELDAIKPDLFLLAEASRREPYWYTHGFDAAYDWTTDLGRWAWDGLFARDDVALALDAAIDAGGYDPAQRVFRFLNNNDTGPRFITAYGPGTTRVATAMLLTLPGVPCVYTGDEVGAEFSPYVDKGPIAWDDRHDLRPYHRRLVHLRRELPALQSHEWHRPQHDHEGTVYVYGRTAEASGADPILVVLNYEDAAVDVRVALPEGLAGLRGRPLRDLLDPGFVAAPAGSDVHVPVAAKTARLLTP